jgi:hypothetical protein
MVQTQPYGGAPAQPAASQDPWDLVEGGGGIPAVKFGSRDAYGRFIPADVGTSYTGILTEDLVKTQVIDFDSKEPKFWKNGDPVMQVVATVQTDLREDDEDNGLRRIFFKSGALTAFQTEVREKKIGRFGPGTRITITLIGFKPNKDPNMNPANVFDVTIGPEIVAWVPAEQRAGRRPAAGAGRAGVGLPDRRAAGRPAGAAVRRARPARLRGSGRAGGAGTPAGHAGGRHGGRHADRDRHPPRSGDQPDRRREGARR